MKTTIATLAALMATTATAGEFSRQIDKLEGTSFWNFQQASSEDPTVVLFVQGYQDGTNAWGIAKTGPFGIWVPDNFAKGAFKQIRYRTDSMKAARNVTASIAKQTIVAGNDTGFVLGGSELVARVDHETYTFDLSCTNAAKARTAYVEE